MTVYYALIHVTDNGRHSFVYGDHDIEAVNDRFIAEELNAAIDRDTGGDAVGKFKIVKLPADNLLAAYLDQQMAAYLDQQNAGISVETLDEAIAEEVKQANDRIEQHAAAAAPAKPIAPAGTLVGTVPANYPHMDKHGLDATRRRKMQFDTVTAEGIAAIPEIDVTPNQIRYAGDIGAIHVDRRSIPFRYRFSDVLEYIAARDAGEKPATVAKRHAKAAAQ